LGTIRLRVRDPASAQKNEIADSVTAWKIEFFTEKRARLPLGLKERKTRESELHNLSMVEREHSAESFPAVSLSDAALDAANDIDQEDAS
jgi:hypothetical protein